MKLEARAKRREQLIKLAKDSVIDRASKLFISQYRVDLEHLKPGDQVQPSVPVGKDKFVSWVKQVLTQFFPEVSGTVENEKILKEYAVQIAQSVAQSNTDMQNPLRDYEISKDPIFVRAGNKVYIKSAQYMTESNDQKADPKQKNLYTAPTEHSRYCPDHPGSMMRRVSDNVYQCPISGDLNTVEPWKEKYSYTDGHEVKFETGVQNQTSAGWNYMQPILPFLHPDTNRERILNPKGKEYGYEREKLYGVKSPEFPFRQSGETEKEASALLSRITKQAQYNEKFFGATTIMTRQCPDHPGQQMSRVEDNVRQCPLDDKIYDFERGFTTEDGVQHSGGSVMNQHSIPPGSIIIKKEAQAKDNVHGFLYTHVLPYLGEQAEYARRVLNYKFSNPGMSLEQALVDIKKADELAVAQKQSEAGAPIAVAQPATAELKGFARRA